MEHNFCEGADFCHEIAGDTDVSFTRTYRGTPPTRRIVTTENFVLVADLSPLVVGHLLLLPRKHYLSYSKVVRDASEELLALLAWLEPTYCMTFGMLCILEHGSSTDVDQRACITHAHWHLVPVAGDDVHSLMTADNLVAHELCSVRELGDPAWTDSSYFLLYHAGWYRLYKPVGDLRRQYLRSIVGRLVGMSDPEWDYAVIVRMDHLRKTMALVRGWRYPNDVEEG